MFEIAQCDMTPGIDTFFLNHPYLRQWATELAITDLLEYALKGQQPPRFSDDPRQQRLF
ncbi:MAG: hypothetical protein WCK70_14960 [Chloroflexales bacterium]